jgi:hypothetical protein
VGHESVSWLPSFSSQIAPNFVASKFNLPDVGSRRIFCLGLDEMRMPMEAKLCLCDIYYDILGSRVVPQSGYRKKIVPIVNSGKDLLLAGSYKLICLLACGRKFKEKMICKRLDFLAEKNGILCSTQYSFRGTQDC